MLAAIPRTVSGDTPMVPPPAKASPESFSSTRSKFGTQTSSRKTDPQHSSECWGSNARPELGLAHLEARERRDVRAGLLEDLGHALLVVLRERLLLEHGLLEEAGHATLDDLVERGLRLALADGDLPGDATFVGDGLLGDVLARGVERAERGDVLRDVLGHVGVLRRERDQDA